MRIILKLMKKIAKKRKKTCVFAKKNSVIDEVVALVFRAPHSFTGENVVEFSCHGGAYITQKILHTVFNAGAVPAAAGEFTKRAFLNGKIDLTKAESIMDLISAQNENAAKSAILAHEGALYQKISSIKALLIELASKLSVWADYPDDEEISNINSEEIEQTLKESLNELEKLLNTYNTGKLIKHGIKTAIIGTPNVGKSTLMNLLLGHERAIVTEIAGTTRDTIEETASIGGVNLCLIDTAGIRETDDFVEKIGIKKAQEALKNADLILAVLDGSRPLNEQDFRIISQIKKDFSIAVINKTDLPLKLETEKIRNFFRYIVNISSISGKGLDNLKKHILNTVNVSNFDPNEAILATERQFFEAKNALLNLREAKNELNSGLTWDAISVLVEGAIDNLCKLTGESATEAILDEVFSKFCVGK